jgi:hypothetical protein
VAYMPVKIIGEFGYKFYENQDFGQWPKSDFIVWLYESLQKTADNK